MADDLDAFFDEVEEVAAQAEQQQQQNEPDQGNSAEVVVANDDNKNDNDNVPPPRKKAKPTIVGVVVAAASEKKKKVETTTTSTTDQSESNHHHSPEIGSTTTRGSVPPPPPPPSTAGPPLPIGPLPTPAGPGTAATATAPANPNPAQKNNNNTKKPHVRTAAGKTWVDPTLDEWPDNDFRIFVGNLDPSVTDAHVWAHFARYPSLLKAKVIRDQHKAGTPSRGYAFCSFGDALDCAKALREMDQTWLGSRPCRLKRSQWKDRELPVVRKKEKQSRKQQKRLGLL